MLSYLWTLDNYLAILFFCGFIIYVALCIIGWLFDQTIHYIMQAWSYCNKRARQLKRTLADTFFAMDP